MIKIMIILIMMVFSINMYSINTYKISLSMCMIESNGNPYAIGDKHLGKNYSVGLCQIRLNTAKWIVKKLIKDKKIKNKLNENINKYGLVTILKDARINIYLSNTYLNYLLLKHNNNLKQAIISYNTGLHAKRKIRSTSGEKYYKKVIKKFIEIYDIKELKKLFNIKINS